MRITDSDDGPRTRSGDLNADMSSLSRDCSARCRRAERSRARRTTRTAPAARLRCGGEVEGLQQYQRNVDDGVAWLNASDTALSKIGDAVQRARELLIQAGSDSAGPRAREAAAAEIDQLIETVKQEANVQYAGRYIFAGTATDRTPYQLLGTGHVRRQRRGDPARDRPEGRDRHQRRRGAAARQRAGRRRRPAAAHAARHRRRPPQRTTATRLRGTDIQRLDANFDVLNQIRADIGARTNRLETAACAPRAAGAELDRAALAGRGRRHGQDADRLHDAAGRLQHGAQGRRERRPELPDGLPAIAQRGGEPLSLTIDSTRFGQIEVDAGQRGRVPARHDRPREPPLRAGRARGGRRLPLAALGRGPVARAAGDRSAALLRRPSRSSWRTRSASGSGCRSSPRPTSMSPFGQATSSKDFTANLRAPIVISEGRGHQVINQAAGRAAASAALRRARGEGGGRAGTRRLKQPGRSATRFQGGTSC